MKILGAVIAAAGLGLSVCEYYLHGLDHSFYLIVGPAAIFLCGLGLRKL